MEKPTKDQLLEEDGYKEISSESVDRWRWGTVERTIWQRDSDATYWMAKYRVSTDGETHELRDGDDTEIVQVEPYEKTVTDYRKVAA